VEFVSSGATFVRLEGKPNFRALGKRFGKRTPLAANAIAALSDEALRRMEAGEEVAIAVEGESHSVLPEEVTILRRAQGDLVVKEEGAYFAALDAQITPELRAEGLAREFVSRVQRLRKEAGLSVSDRITLHIGGTAEVETVVASHRDYISAEVLAVSLEVGTPADESSYAVQRSDLDGLAVSIALRKAD
jgi:isoleucyl-tRNA synthetase